MKRCVITTLTNTGALRIRQALASSYISAQVIRLTRAMGSSGCAYGVEIDISDRDRAERILSVSDLEYRRILTLER